MDVEMLHQLSQRSITLDGGKSNLGLESRCVVTARSSAHSLSCSRLSSPLSGRNSTYRPVQICESSSEFQSMLQPSSDDCICFNAPRRQCAQARRDLINRDPCLFRWHRNWNGFHFVRFEAKSFVFS